jgi:hypothetical protein
VLPSLHVVQTSLLCKWESTWRFFYPPFKTKHVYYSYCSLFNFFKLNYLQLVHGNIKIVLVKWYLMMSLYTCIIYVILNQVKHLYLFKHLSVWPDVGWKAKWKGQSSKAVSKD